MNISLSRRLKVNLGNYESFEFSAQSTVNHGDLGLTDTDVQEGVKENGDSFLDDLIVRAKARCEKTLDLLLIADIETSRDLTEEDRSVVLRAFFPDHPTTQQASDRPTRSPARRPRRPSSGR